VTVNGQPIQFDGAQPHTMDGQVMVPIRRVFEGAGGVVTWDHITKTVIATKGDREMRLNVNAKTATINGEDVSLDGDVHIMEGTTMVPIRFLGDALQAQVQWDEINSQVNFTTPDAVTTYGETNEITPTPETVTTLPSPDMAMPPVGSALKVTLDKELNTNSSYVGEPISATLDTNGNSDYFGLPDGTSVRGHVTFVQPMSNGLPGVLGIAFDELVLNDGRTLSISASPIDADADIETGDDGRWMATSTAKWKSDLKFIGVNSSTSGVLVPLAANTTTVSVEEIDQAIPNWTDPTDVVITEGTLLGVRIDP